MGNRCILITFCLEPFAGMAVKGADLLRSVGLEKQTVQQVSEEALVSLLVPFRLPNP